MQVGCFGRLATICLFAAPRRPKTSAHHKQATRGAGFGIWKGALRWLAAAGRFLQFSSNTCSVTLTAIASLATLAIEKVLLLTSNSWDPLRWSNSSRSEAFGQQLGQGHSSGGSAHTIANHNSNSASPALLCMHQQSHWLNRILTIRSIVQASA